MAKLSRKAEKEEKSYPFDVEKAYHLRRGGIMAGGRVSYSYSEDGVVKHLSYEIRPPENECGMRDKGADVYFIGLKEGSTVVTMTWHYPTCEDETEQFTLKVDANFTVTKI